jgi:hypothetical protein
MNPRSLASIVSFAALVLVAPALLALLTACGDSVGAYCGYTDCNAPADAGVDGAVDAGALAPDAE